MNYQILIERTRKTETLQDRYKIYVEQAKELGQEIKSFEEWLIS